MSTALVLRLRDLAAGSVSWGLFDDASGKCVRHGTQAADQPLEMPEHLTAPARVWAIVPGTDVLWREIELPVRGGNRARAAAAFILEDELAVDTEDMHFAVANGTEATRAVVAVAHATMKSWRQWLSANALTADVIVPDFLAVPFNAVIVDQALAIVHGEKACFAIESDLLPAVIGDAFAVAPQPRAIDDKGLLETFHGVLASGPALNLMQGAYAPPRRFTFDKAWRRAAILAGATVVLACTAQIVEGLRLQREADAALARAEAVLKDAVPATKRVVNPRAQIRAALADARASSSMTFLKLCQALFLSLEKADDAEVQTLRYDGRRNEIAVTITLPSYESMERLKSDLRGRGAVLQEGGARQDGARIVAEITVRLS